MNIIYKTLCVLFTQNLPVNFDKVHRKHNQENQNCNLFVWGKENTEAEIFTCSTQAPEEESTDSGAISKNFGT